MTIAQVVPSLKPCGPVNVAHDISECLSSHNVPNIIIYYDDYNNPVNFRVPCINISNTSKIDWSTIDVVHAHGYRPTKFLEKIKNLYPNIALVTTMHNYIFEDFKYEYGAIKGFLASQMYIHSLKKSKAAIVALSKHAMNYYSAIFPKAQLYHAYNCRNLNDLDINDKDKQTILEFKGSGKLLNTVSVLNKRKNISSLLNALVLLPDDIKLCIIGDGDQMLALKNIASKLKITDRVLFLGKRDSAYRYMQLMDLFVLPSLSEGFPLSLIEASAMRKKTVTSDLPMISELFMNGRDLIVTNVNNPQVFANDIIRALQMDSLSSNIRNVYESYFTPEKLFLQYQHIYTSLTKS